MATLAQTLANQANARKSTGPRTQEGKDAARRNALKHGLASETLVLPDEEAAAVAARVEAWTPTFKPRDDFGAWLVRELAASSVQLDRCRDLETALRDRAIGRAGACWAEDRETAAAELGATLHKAPSVVARKLKGTSQGIDWLIDRWEGLRRALDEAGEWDESQAGLAHDLLGTPAEFRGLASPLDSEGRRHVVEARLSDLRELKAEILAIEDRERVAAEVGLGVETDKALMLARRYESAQVRRFDKALRQLHGKERSADRAEDNARERDARDRAEDRARMERFAKEKREAAEPAPPETPAAPPPPAPVPVPVAPPVATVAENRRARRARLARMRRRG